MTERADERGAVIPLLALCVAIIVLVSVLTIDLGRAMVLRRDLQKNADIAAIDASKFLTTATASAQLATIRNAAMRSAARNHAALDPADVHLVQRSGTSWTRVDTSAVAPDGVEVVARGSVSYDFQPGGTSTARSAVASRQSAAGIEIGTNLATIDSTQSAMLNQVFGLFGGNSGMNVSLASWQALAGANVRLGDLVAAAGSGSGRAFLQTSATYGTQLQILASALNAEGNTTAATAVTAYRNALSATVQGIVVKAGDLLAVSTVAADTFTDASLNVFSLLQGELFLARKGSLVNGALASGVPGITVSLSARVVQPPTIAFGPVGTNASNGQIDFGIGATLLGAVSISLGANAATGIATVASVACSSIGPSTSATASVRTSLTGLSLTVAGLPVALGLTAVPPTTLTFSAPFTWAHSQHVGATSLGLTTAIGGALSPLLNLTVGSLLTPLQDAVFSPILKSLGVSVAGADVAVLDPLCLPTVLAR